MEQIKLPKKVKFMIFWIILFSLIGYLLSVFVYFRGVNGTVSIKGAFLSLLYLIFAFGLAKKEKWAWVGAFIYPIIIFLFFSFNLTSFKLENLIIYLILLFIVLLPILICRKDYNNISDKKITFNKSIFFWLLIIVVVLATVQIFYVREEQKMRQMCHEARLESNAKIVMMSVERYYDDGGKYPSSVGPGPPTSFLKYINTRNFEEINRNLKKCYYKWVDNTSDSQKYCFYAYSEYTDTYYVASDRGFFDCSDRIPTLNDCCQKKY